jgi:hypothetical protein
MRIPQLVRSVSATLVLLSLAPASFGTISSGLNAERRPANIIFSKSNVVITAGQGLAVTARILDQRQAELKQKIEWKVPPEANHLVVLRPLDSTGSNVLLTASPNIPAARTFMIQARSGYVSRPLSVTVQSRAPAMSVQSSATPTQLLIKEGKKVTLSVGGKETLHAIVFDGQGNRVRGSQVKWRLAKQAEEAFVYLGQTINDATDNSIEIVWRPAPAGQDAPSEIQLHAIVNGIFETIAIEYKSLPAEDNKITFDEKELIVQPGGTATVKVTVSGDKNQTLDTKIEKEILGDEASKLIKVIGPDKEHKLTLVGLNAGNKTPDVVMGVLTVKSAGASASIPVRYQKDLIATFWEIVPPNIVGDNYGRTIKKDYYCVEVSIRNTSGSDIALAALAFVKDDRPRPTTSYYTAHGSMAKRKLTHPRSLVLAIVDGVGSLMTGFVPFFHNDTHKANYSTFIDVISNPLAKGLATVWKDPYPDELARFETDVLKDDKIISNGGIFKTKVFFPKRVLFRNGDPDREDLDIVRDRLGELVLMGYRLGPFLNLSRTP